MATKWMVLGKFIALLLIVAKGAEAQISYGFSEADFSGSEGPIEVTIVKDGLNTGDIVLSIQKFTFDQFNASGMPLPVELDPDITGQPFPDPADLSPADFNNETRMVTFPPSTVFDQITIDIDVFDDEIHEVQEGLLLFASIAAINELDNQTMPMPIRNGVAMIIIFNDDMLTLGFNNPAYVVDENDLNITNLVFVSRDIDSEVELPLIVQSTPGTATSDPPGADFTFETQVLTFSPDVDQLSVDFTILEDIIVEMQESFMFTLSLPMDPPPDYIAGPFATVAILDDDFAVVGYEQEEYRVNEGDLFVEICLVLITPSDLSLVEPFVFVVAESRPETADGNGIDYEDYSIEETLVSNRQCENISLIDDTEIEDTEQFILNGSFLVPSGNITFDPSLAVVFIEDNDAIATTTDDLNSGGGSESTTPVPTGGEETGGGTAVTMGGDPHFSILLPTGQPLCFSIQGERGFTFNLISNDLLQLNALFVPDAVRGEVTWIGELGIVVKGAKYKVLNDTKLQFVAEEKTIYLDNNRATLDAQRIGRVHLSKGKLTLVEEKKERSTAVVDVVLEDVGLEFSVRFVKGTHLDMVWKKVMKGQPHSHGLIGQFLRSGVKVDEVRRLLILPNMEPVPVMRKPVWHFMERDTPDEQLCWVTMNPGYQGKRLIEGHYFDYLVDNVLSSTFEFKEK